MRACLTAPPHRGEGGRRWSVLVVGAAAAFAVGLGVGVLVSAARSDHGAPPPPPPPPAAHNGSSAFAAVAFVARPPAAAAAEGLLEGGVYWGRRVERALPAGYGRAQHDQWAAYVRGAAAARLEDGCGRMQNRLIVFEDGTRACVRYRQNTDQIQGEVFSFYLAQLLGLPNLAPSAISVVDLRAPLWAALGGDVAAAQWHSRKPVVLTRYVDDLAAAPIPAALRPADRRLGPRDLAGRPPRRRRRPLAELIELAQWSDLIVFDYLTANLDRVVNNLYNHQWNVNIMDAPAHNLARRTATGLLVFLDNESGLLHGYRLLHKYEPYHAALLDGLCLFRRATADAVRRLRRRGDVGRQLRDMFERHSDAALRDVLPGLPDKTVKILNERIERVYSQIVKCEALYAPKGGGPT